MQILRQICQLGNVLWSGAAAAADHLYAEVFDEVHQGHAQLHGGEVVYGLATDVLGESGVGDAGNGEGRLLGQVLDVVFHQIRAGGAVETQDVDRVGFQNGQGRRHFGADEHSALLLHGDGNHQGQADASGFKRLPEWR